LTSALHNCLRIRPACANSLTAGARGAKKIADAKNDVSGVKAVIACPAQPHDTDYYNDIIMRVAGNGDLDGCTNLLRTMRSRGVMPSGMTLSIILEACVKVGDFDRACGLLEEMRKTGTNVKGMLSIVCVRGFVKAGLLQEAQDLMEQAEPNVSACRILLAAHAEHGDSIRIIHTLKIMVSQGLALDPSIVDAALLTFKPPPKLNDDGVLRVFNALVACGMRPSLSTAPWS